MPLLAFAAGALVAWVPARFQRLAATVVVLAGISGWLAYPRMENWICWKESQVNSEARRAWTTFVVIGGVLVEMGVSA